MNVIQKNSENNKHKFWFIDVTFVTTNFFISKAEINVKMLAISDDWKYWRKWVMRSVHCFSKWYPQLEKNDENGQSTDERTILKETNFINLVVNDLFLYF